METIKLRDEYIKLGQALKAAGLVESGVEAKYAVEDGNVKVNGRGSHPAGQKAGGRRRGRLQGRDHQNCEVEKGMFHDH